MKSDFFDAEAHNCMAEKKFVDGEATTLEFTPKQIYKEPNQKQTVQAAVLVILSQVIKLF